MSLVGWLQVQPENWKSTSFRGKIHAESIILTMRMQLKKVALNVFDCFHNYLDRKNSGGIETMDHVSDAKC